jgi:hypothetical protein
VNTDAFTVTAYFFDSGVSKENVPFCFPYQHLDKGILFMPEKGSIGVAVWGLRREPVIVSFIAPLVMLENGAITRVNPAAGNFTLEPLEEGEVMLQGCGRSSIKLDKTGGVLLSTPLFTFIKLDDLSNTAMVNAENFYLVTEGRSELTGVKKDSSDNPLAIPGETSKYYTNEVIKVFDTSDNTINLNLDPDLVPDIAPIMEVQRGNVFSGNTVVSKVSSAVADLCYRLQVLIGANKKSVVEIDKAANLYLGNRATEYKGVARIGDTVTVNVNGIDYTGTITTGSANVLASE